MAKHGSRSDADKASLQMMQWVCRQNIARLAVLLAAEGGRARRDLLLALLAEEEARIKEIQALLADGRPVRPRGPV